MGPRQVWRQRTLTVGKMVDSADDMARLMIVTQYAGSRNVKVYVQPMTGDYREYGDQERVTSAAMIDITTGSCPDPDTRLPWTDMNNVRLRSVGAYYSCLGDNTAALTAVDRFRRGRRRSSACVLRCEHWRTIDPAPMTVTRQRTYVVLKARIARSQRAGPPPPPTPIRNVGIHVRGHRFSPMAMTPLPTLTRSKGDGCKIPEATDYEHIHFGVWAALGEAAEGRYRTRDRRISASASSRTSRARA